MKDLDPQIMHSHFHTTKKKKGCRRRWLCMLALNFFSATRRPSWALQSAGPRWSTLGKGPGGDPIAPGRICSTDQRAFFWQICAGSGWYSLIANSDGRTASRH